MFFSYTELHKWDVFSSGQVPRLMPGIWSCLLPLLGEETEGKDQTPCACQQAKGGRKQPEGLKGANSIKPPLEIFVVLSYLDYKMEEGTYLLLDVYTTRAAV